MAASHRRESSRVLGKAIRAASPTFDSLEPRRHLSAASAVRATAPAAPRATTTTTTGITTTPRGLIIPDTDIRRATRPGAPVAYTQYQYAPASGYGPATVAPFTPTQIRAAYGMNSILFGAITGDGTGQTIAIVDAYDNPSFVSSTDPNFNNSDLHRFDFDTAYLGTAGRINVDPPTFTKLDQRGGTTYPAYNVGWAFEIALDVEWAHVMAPNADIVLVEADSNYDDDLRAAVNYAKAIPGVTAISMSYVGEEYESETADEAVYQQAGVSFLAATGDSGSPGGHPAYSANVVAVGGTTLTRNGDAYTETGWSGSGGGISAYVGRPAYQTLLATPSPTHRTIPDVAADANPDSGVYVLDTSYAVHSAGKGLATQQPATWYRVGGTSLSAPLWAGIVAVANQGRSLAGLSSFASSQALLTRLYTLPAADYNDILAGVSNGNFSTATGYDLVTGRGSPRPSLAAHVAGGSLTGELFIDADADANFDAGEAGIAGLAVYLDANDDGVQDLGEPTATTTASGSYTFADLIGGVAYVVRLAASASADYIATAATSPSTPLNYGTTAGPNFGLFPRSLTGSAFTVRLDDAGTSLQVYAINPATGTPGYSIGLALLGSNGLTFNGTAADADTFTLDLTNGNPLPAGGLTFATTTAADTLRVIGTTAADTLTLDAGALRAGGAATLVFGTLGTIRVTLDAGDDRLDVNALAAGTSLTVDPGAGDDTIALGTSAGLTDAIAGDVALPLATADDAILFDDRNATVGHVYTLAGGATGGSFVRGDKPGTLTFGAGIRLALTPGAGDDVVTVTPRPAARLNLFADAAGTGGDDDRLRVLAPVNTGVSFSAGTTLEDGAYAFANGEGAITFAGVERNLPFALTAFYDYGATIPSVVVTFNVDVSASLAADDLALVDLGTNATPAATAVAYDPLTNTARFAVDGLPDGDFHASLATTLVGSAAGDLLLDVPLDFFVLAGDANRDRAVNFDDLLIVAQNYGTTGKTFGEGNLNHSTDGSVDFDDLLVLAQHYGSLLPALRRIAPSPPLGPRGRNRSGRAAGDVLPD